MSVISMLALGSWNDGAGWPTCSIGTRERSTVESILAHFEVAQILSDARPAPLHEVVLAARAAARARSVSGLRRSALARRSPRPRAARRRLIAARAPPGKVLEPGA